MSDTPDLRGFHLEGDTRQGYRVNVTRDSIPQPTARCYAGLLGLARKAVAAWICWHKLGVNPHTFTAAMIDLAHGIGVDPERRSDCQGTGKVEAHGAEEAR